MAVQDTGIGDDLVRVPPAPRARPLRSVRRLPVQKDWPMLAIVAAQVGRLHATPRRPAAPGWPGRPGRGWDSRR